MGRHNKRPTTDGDIIDQDHIASGKVSEAVVDRLGLNNSICVDCNANNPEPADSCRKCGGDTRPKRSQYSDA